MRPEIKEWEAGAEADLGDEKTKRGIDMAYGQIDARRGTYFQHVFFEVRNEHLFIEIPQRRKVIIFLL